MSTSCWSLTIIVDLFRIAWWISAEKSWPLGFPLVLFYFMSSWFFVFLSRLVPEEGKEIRLYHCLLIYLKDTKQKKKKKGRAQFETYNKVSYADLNLFSRRPFAIYERRCNSSTVCFPYCIAFLFSTWLQKHIMFGVLVCWISSIEKMNKQNNDAVLWSSPRNPKLMFVNICQCLFTFYLLSSCLITLIYCFLHVHLFPGFITTQFMVHLIKMF